MSGWMDPKVRYIDLIFRNALFPFTAPYIHEYSRGNVSISFFTSRFHCVIMKNPVFLPREIVTLSFKIKSKRPLFTCEGNYREIMSVFRTLVSFMKTKPNIFYLDDYTLECLITWNISTSLIRHGNYKCFINFTDMRTNRKRAKFLNV